ncbi:UNVERIFIED_CONTAM: Coiled-coil and C2 domain-containing protein 2A [Siphonaria sp. JEL0065]|nr:Coiled-coil and C2 domain-containing protein 2A [Siphonaria sp. JEL0065]
MSTLKKNKDGEDDDEVMQEADTDAIEIDKEDNITSSFHKLKSSKESKKGRKEKKKKPTSKRKHEKESDGEIGGSGEERDTENGDNENRHSKKNASKKKDRRGSKRSIDKNIDSLSASDADNESGSDPFDEFREATERAEIDMIETYVARAKWESMEPTNETLKKLLFYPESYILPPSESLTALFESLRFPDDEGLYVGQYPKVKQHNLTKMERRLGAEWFGPNQRLAALPIPKRARTQRPGAPPPVPVAQAAPMSDSTMSLSRSSVSLRFIEDTTNPIIEDPFDYIDNMGLVLRKPHPTTPHTHIANSSDGYYTLVFSLGRLEFTEHPLLTEECKLAKEVEDWIFTLRARKKIDLVGFLTRKLEALKQAYTDYIDRTERILNSTHTILPLVEEEGGGGIYPAKPTSSKYYETHVLPREEEEKERIRLQDSEKRREFREDIRSTRLLRDAEAHTNRLLEFKILQSWERIKKLRKRNSLISSSLRVMIRARQPVTSIEEDKFEFHKEVEEELLELEELHDSEMERQRRLYKNQLKEWRRRQEAEEERTEKRSDENDNIKLSKRMMLLGSGVERDPLAESDEEERQLIDDGISGHAWLRESSESIRNQAIRGKKQDKKRLEKEEAIEREQQEAWQ